MRDRVPDPKSLSGYAIASELGFGIAAPLVVCTGLGWYLDGVWGTKPWLVLIGLGIGLLSMFGTFYRLATQTAVRTPPKGTGQRDTRNDDSPGAPPDGT